MQVPLNVAAEMLIEGNIFWVLGGIFVLVTLSKLALLLGCQSKLGAGPRAIVAEAWLLSSCIFLVVVTIIVILVHACSGGCAGDGGRTRSRR